MVIGNQKDNVGPMSWKVYLLKCSDNSLYCGISNDIETRVSKHNSGIGAKYTRSRLPVELIAVSRDLTKNEALKLEHYIKQLQPCEKVSVLQQRILEK
jgi:putative endonuclease